MNDLTTNRPVEILLVEDNPGDVRLTAEAFKEGKIFNNLSVVPDGQAAMDFLNRRDEYHDAPRPDVILLDLNLPKKSGREVLAELKDDPQLRRIPVVVLTTSTAEEDIFKSYDLHANCYITKPVDFEQFMAVIQSIEGFWLAMVKLPPR